MNIAALSTIMNQSIAQQSVGIAVMKMAVNVGEDNATQMTKMMVNIAVDNNLGNHIDITV